MKKLLLLFTLLSLSLSSFAASYRGMFDINFGISTNSTNTLNTPYGDIESKSHFGGVISTSHGCQITPFLFAGAGFGVGMNFMKLEPVSFNSGKHEFHPVPTIPVFVDLRWDLDVRKKITPFVDIKIGYNFGGFESDCSLDFTGPVRNEGWINSCSSVFFQPTAGVRFKKGRRSGFNLGLTYLPTLKSEFFVDDISEKFSNGLLMLNLGIDF